MKRMSTKKLVMRRVAMMLLVAVGTTVAAWAQQPTGNWTDSGNYSTEWMEGDHTIYIANEAQMAGLINKVNDNQDGTELVGYTIILQKDLDMSAHYWTPIGKYSDVTQYKHPFSGIFDGQGHTISGIHVNRPNESYNGLFGYVYSSNIGWKPVIKNLKLTNSNITGGSYTGGVVGQINHQATISDIICDATVSGNNFVGGIVGEAHYQEGSTIAPTVEKLLYTGNSVTGSGNVGAVIGAISEHCSHNSILYTQSGLTAGSEEQQAYPLNIGNVPATVRINWVDTPGVIDGTTLYLPDGAAMRLGPWCPSSDGNSMPTTRITGLAIDGVAQTLSPDCLYRHTFNAATESSKTLTISTATLDISGNGSEGNPYLISSVEKWDAFTNAVTNGGITFAGKFFKLWDNITVTTMAGTSGKFFSGTFQCGSNVGDFYTLTLNYNATEEYCAPFRYINGAIIKNFQVAGTINTSNKYAGGLVGMVDTNTDSPSLSEITNCRSSVIINSTFNGAGYHGGLVARMNHAELNITGCCFDGEINGINTTNCGGFVGGREKWGYLGINIKDCLFAPEAITVQYGKTFYNFDGEMTITNCYYTSTLGDAQGYSPYIVYSIPANRGSLPGDASSNYGIAGFQGWTNALCFNYNNSSPDYYYVSSIGLFEEWSNESLLSELTETTGTYYNKPVSITLSGRTFIKDGYWNTLCLPFNATKTGPLADATIMELDTDGEHDRHKTGLASDGTLYLNFKDAESIVAGKPYIVKWPSGSNIMDPVFSGVTVTSTSPTTVTANNSGLKTVQFIGSYERTALPINEKSNLFLGDENKLYYPDGGNNGDSENPKYYVNAFRAWFHIDLTGQSNGVRAFVLNFGDSEASGIENVQYSMFNVQSNNAWYDLSGRRLDGKPSRAGVYIHNGNKVVIK